MLVGALCILLKNHAKITFRIFWFIKPPLIEISSLEEFKRKSYLPFNADTFNNISSGLNTGDLVLFVGEIDHTRFLATKWTCASPIDHLGVVYKDKNGSLKIFESNSADGVNLKDLKEKIITYPSEIIAVRKLKNFKRTDEFYAIIDRFIDEHYGKQHDLTDLHGQIEMARAGIDIHIPFTKVELFQNREEKLEKLFCSELIALLFSHLGFLNLRLKNELLTTNEFTPSDFSNYSNYTLRKKDIKKKQLFNMFEDEVFVLKKDKFTLVE